MNLLKTSLAFLLVLWLGAAGQRVFTHVDNSIITALADHFETTFCIFMRGEYDPLPYVHLNTSYPARNSVLTSVMTFSELEKYIVERFISPKYGGTSLGIIKHSQAQMESLRQVSHRVRLSTLKWVLLLDEATQFNTQMFGDTHIPFDCEFLVVSPRGTFYLMTEVYQVEKGSRYETHNFGTWTVDKSLSAPSATFYGRRNSLKGYTFKAVIGNNPPYTYVNRDATGRPNFGGYFYEVWKELEFRINFRTEYPETYINGDPRSSLNSDTDVVFSVTPITQDRPTATIMDLSEPIYDARVYLFGHRPGSELEWNSYLKPFSSVTWYVSLGWMIGSSLVLAIMYRTAWFFNTSEVEADHYIFTIGESLATVFRAMCMQGSDVTPRSSSCRLLFLSIYMTALVVTSAFSAALFSLLTIPVSRAPFSTFEDVLNTRGYKMGILPDSDIFRGLKYLADTFPESVHDKLYKTLDNTDKLPKSVMEGLDRICLDKMYILMWDLPNVLDEMQNITRDCQDRIMPAGPLVLREHMGFGYRENSPYKELIDLHLVRMRNEGILKRLLLNYWPPRIPTVQTSWVRVTLADISPILYMFSFGAMAGVIILFLEKGKKYLSERQAGSAQTRNKQTIWEQDNYLQTAQGDKWEEHKNYLKEEDWANNYTNWDSNANYSTNKYN